MSDDLAPAASADWPIVALVASAGGIDALSRVLSALPNNLLASIIVLLHSSPDRQSRLPDILSRVSSVAVHAARDGEILAPGCVIVAPAGRHLVITSDLRAALIRSGAYPPSRPSADLLLTTLAIAAGPRAIAVVLTGEGHDGATGATAIHRFGGTVLATDAASSQSFAMPSATIDRDQVIDHVIGLDELPALLVSLVSARHSTFDAPPA
jgi:two-component system, chemotaxis family, protein-glutamate methylesterase/glutaminase